MRLILCDLHGALAEAWERAFAGCADVEVRRGDLFDVSADAYVSPANSYGWMDGGIDSELRERFGYEIQDTVQDAIAARGGMLPVGDAIVVETGDDEVPYLIAAPTMEVPSYVAHTNNAYLAMRALLRAARDFARRRPGVLETIAIPGLCTGTGGMDPDQAAAQMRRAWEEFAAGDGAME
jgi:O-acetyl-ADP-ribose deacetylase (regulator of RNase III)